MEGIFVFHNRIHFCKTSHFHLLFTKVAGGVIDTVSDIFGDDLRETEDANNLPLKDVNPKV